MNIGEEEVYRFILNHIDSVPQMKALLLVWEPPQDVGRKRDCGAAVCRHDGVRNIIQELVQRRLVAADAQSARQYFYKSKSEDLDRPDRSGGCHIPAGSGSRVRVYSYQNVLRRAGFCESFTKERD